MQHYLLLTLANGCARPSTVLLHLDHPAAVYLANLSPAPMCNLLCLHIFHDVKPNLMTLLLDLCFIPFEEPLHGVQLGACASLIAAYQ